MKKGLFLSIAMLIGGSALAAMPPNFIYILADDLGYGDLSCLGQEHFKTPHIDALKARGLFFTDHYSGSTVCAPSRSALLTGQHTGHTFIRGNSSRKPEGQLPIPSEFVLLPERLKEAGYVSGAFGKWGLGYPGSEGDPLNHGFDVFYGYNCQTLGHNYYPRFLRDNEKKVMLPANAGDGKGAYAPALIHERTLQFIEANRDRPFFCYVASIIPHAELAAPVAYMAKIRGTLPEVKKYKGGKKFELRAGGYSPQAEPRTAFAAMVTLLDDQVGEIVAKTEALGMADRTLIIFTSDNGAHKEGGADPEFFNSNGPFRGHKRDLYDGGVHVPMIAYWLGKISPGSESDHLSAFWDIVPTFTELAGVTAPNLCDGLSMVPTLLAQGVQLKHPYLYWEYNGQGGRAAVRLGKWKGIRCDIRTDPDRPMELYDLTVDPGEQNNMAADYPEKVAQMVEIMKAEHVDSSEFPFSM